VRSRQTTSYFKGIAVRFKNSHQIPKEQQALRDRYVHPSGTWLEFRGEDVEQSVSSRFEKQVQKYGQRLAVKRDEHELSYHQLNQLANQIGHSIIAKCAKQAPQAVGILLDNDESMIAAILGVLKTGRAYVPLDPSFPQERLAYYLSDSRANLIVTNDLYRPLAIELALFGHQILNIDHIDQLERSLPTTNLDIRVTPEACAYIYYTSGSTGRPKSVYNNHRNLLHHIRRNSNAFCICPEDRLICLKSFSFNGALKDLFGSLLNGASLHLYPLKQKSTVMLGQWLLEQQITIYNSVATVFRQLVSTLNPESRFPDLRMVFIGGERIKASDIDAYKAYFSPHSLLSLGLGATEAGAITRLYMDNNTPLIEEISSSGLVPVGYPLEDMHIMILDPSGKPVGANQEGQIVIKSKYLALGYWNNADLTQEKFLPVSNGEAEGEKIYLTGDMGYIDQTGSLYCLGRQDFQVKIRGYRVGLEEIEQALLKHPMIKQTVVVAKESRGEQSLVAYYVPAKPITLTVTELRRFLADKLPDYMIPSAFVQLDAFPVTPFGKLDIKALKAPDRSRPNLETAYVEPQTTEEEILTAIWCHLLGIDQVGIHGDFFDLGGHSILMMELFTHVEREFNIDLPLAPFIEHPTIEAMAMLVQEERRF